HISSLSLHDALPICPFRQGSTGSFVFLFTMDRYDFIYKSPFLLGLDCFLMTLKSEFILIFTSDRKFLCNVICRYSHIRVTNFLGREAGSRKQGWCFVKS